MKNTVKETKKIVFLVILLVVIGVSTAYAQNESDFDFHLNQEGTGVVVTGYRGNATDIRIPATIQGFPVRSFGSFFETTREIFSHYPITSIEIPEGVTEIRDNAFTSRAINGPSYTNLRNVTIPSTVVRIGERAFYDCRSLTSINLPPNITAIEPETFSRSGLRTIVIPEGVTEIGQEAFSYSDLTTVTLPSTIRTIGRWAFPRSLTTINIPDSVTRIEFGGGEQSGAFRGTNFPLATQARLRQLGYTGEF